MAAAGCGEVLEPGATDGGIAEPSLACTWEVESGVLFPSFFLGPDDTEYVELVPSAAAPEAGAGEYFVTKASGLLDCVPLTYSEHGGDAVTFSVTSIQGFGLRVLEHQGEDLVVVTDALGRTADLRRIDDIPSGARCREAAVAAQVPLPSQAQSFSGLAHDGTLLWHESGDSNWTPFDPSSRSFGVPRPIPPTAGQFRHIHAHQDGGFWTHCGCGGSSDARLVDAETGDTLAAVDTTDLATTISVRGIATDGATLFLGGSSFQDNRAHLLEVDPATPALLADTPLDFPISGLAIRDGEVWALTSGIGRSVTRIDRESGGVLETIGIPTEADIRGFAWIGDTLYGIGSFNLFELSLP
jgi:hypothetical protein